MTRESAGDIERNAEMEGISMAIDGEQWTETKVLRRFIWHDRIHAKALYRHGLKMGVRETELDGSFCFSKD